MFSRAPLPLTLALLLGCQSTPDANPQVFLTSQQTYNLRQEQQMRLWQDQAITILKHDRPDLQASPAPNFAITLQADGLHHTIPLADITPALLAQTPTPTPALRNYLRRQLIAFDQQRLAALPFDQVRPRLRPMLLSQQDLTDLADLSPPTTLITPNLLWTPAIRWTPTAQLTPISSKSLSAWNLKPADLQQIALDNLQHDFQPDLIQTTPLGPMGQMGHLQPSANPALILLPDFLSHVRQTWNTTDDLTILVASPTIVRFLEKGNQRLLDLTLPQWQRLLEQDTAPLSRSILVLSDKGITEMDLPAPKPLLPTSRPATLPTTRRVLHIAR